MKLAVKFAGLLGSGVFLLTALPGFYQNVKPVSMDAMIYESVPGISILESLGMSLAGAVVAGIIGYMIGDILSKPKGKPKRSRSAKSSSRSGGGQVKPSAPVTGNEVFLDDVGSGSDFIPEKNALPIETSPVEDV